VTQSLSSSAHAVRPNRNVAWELFRPHGPKDEVGVQYDVVPSPEIRGAVMSFPQSSVIGKSESEKATDQEESQAKVEEVPRGYMFHVASLVSIEPGRDLLFSLPVNHLSKKWHIEIPFEFELPKGKGPHDPISGGGGDLA